VDFEELGGLRRAVGDRKEGVLCGEMRSQSH
jgi:hypothetical protein